MGEEIAFANCRISDFQGLVTLTLDRVILHTVMHRPLTSTDTKFHWNRKNFLWTDRQTYRHLRLLEVDLKIRPVKQISIVAVVVVEVVVVVAIVVTDQSVVTKKRKIKSTFSKYLSNLPVIGYVHRRRNDEQRLTHELRGKLAHFFGPPRREEKQLLWTCLLTAVHKNRLVLPHDQFHLVKTSIAW